MCGVETVLPGNRVGRTTETRGAKNPIGIREAVEKPEVFEAAVSSIEAVPRRLLNAESKVTLRICPPAGRSYQKTVNELPFTVLRFQQKAAVE